MVFALVKMYLFCGKPLDLGESSLFCLICVNAVLLKTLNSVSTFLAKAIPYVKDIVYKTK